jgi:Helicase associated domain
MRRRSHNLHSTLTQERADALARIGFELNASQNHADQLDKIWNSQYEELKKYRRIHGHCNVPQNRKVCLHFCRPLVYSSSVARLTFCMIAVSNAQSDASLAIWVGNQRSRFKNSSLSRDRVILLEGIDFEWKQKRGVKAGGMSAATLSRLCEELPMSKNEDDDSVKSCCDDLSFVSV